MQKACIWIVTACVVALGAVACTESPSSNRATARVLVSTSVGAAAVTPSGVPTDGDGQTGVAAAELTIYRGGAQIYLDGAGVEVDAADAEPILLTPTANSVELILFHGTYDFLVAARDDQEPTPNDLADGSVLGVVVHDDVNVRVPLVSLIGSAVFGAPVTVLPNQVFDVFLTVRPPNRTDLRVPTGDFTATYDVIGSTPIGSSELGIRMTATCGTITITADVTRSGEAIPSTQANTVIGVDFLCPTSTIPVSIDLIPPFVSISSPLNGSTATIDTPVELSGPTNDDQTGVASVEIYDGVALLGTATIEEGVPQPWTFTFTPNTARTYNLTAIATDNAGNQSGTTVQLVVEE